MYQHPLPGTLASARIRGKATAFSVSIFVLAALLQPGKRMTERTVMGRENQMMQMMKSIKTLVLKGCSLGKEPKSLSVSHEQRLEMLEALPSWCGQTHSPSVVHKAGQRIGKWLFGESTRKGEAVCTAHARQAYKYV